MVIRDRLPELRDAILAAAAASGVTDIRVFGSAARGEDAQESDIDFLVSLPRGGTLLDLARLEIRLEAVLGRRVDVVTERGLREPIRSTALGEALRV
jgi:predicted nucleotidyltransferase